MKDKLSAFWKSFVEKWKAIAKGTKIFIITALCVVIVAAIVLTAILNQKSYTAIYTGLDNVEAGQVVTAINDLGITDFDNDLNGTTATVFCADETSGAAVFARETKANPALVEKIVPKCAYVENKYLDKAGVKALSAIPSKEVLIAKMLGCFQSPLSKFVGVLDQIAKAKESN